MNNDYYDESRSLAAMMRLEGIQNESMGILRAIDEGFTSTEILMGIRFHISLFLSSREGTSELRRNAEEIKMKIDGVLG